MANEEDLKQRIIQLFRDNGTPSSDGNGVELPLKDIWQPLRVEKRAVNRILHNTPAYFTKIKDSPPLWRYRGDQTATNVTPTAATASLPSTTTNTAHSTSTPEPDVVVKKKEVVDSPSKKERLKPQVLRVLSVRSVPMTALQIAKEVGCETTGDVNPTLYDLKSEDKVTKLEDKWTLKSNASDVSSLLTPTRDIHLDSPMKLDEKPLYTREDVCQDGRKEVRFREVLPKDVAPKKPEACDEADSSKQPFLQADPIDEEMLGVLSSLYDDPTEFDLVVNIVKMLKASGDTPLDDADIFMKLNHTTRELTKPILESLELNGLVEKIDGAVIKWKWKRN